MNMRYKIVELEQRSQEWIDFRRGKFGASMASALKGVSPFQTKLQLWEEFFHETQKTPTKAMLRGIELESKALDWLNSKKGFSGVYKPVVVQSCKDPRIIASLDGFYINEGRPHIVEIKCPGTEAHLEAIEGRIPSYYYPQLQHQMHLVGADSMLYVSFDGEQGVILVCHRDEKYCEQLENEEIEFLDSVVNLKPPTACDRDWIEIYDSRASTMARKYEKLMDQMSALEYEIEETKKELLQSLNHPRTKVGNLKIQKVVRKGSIDYDSLCKDRGIEVSEEYRRPAIESWRITSS